MPADDHDQGAVARTLKSRRDRLVALRTRHQEVGAKPAPRASGPAATGSGASGSAVQGPGARPAVSPQTRQLISRLHRMLTQGPDDGSGTVPGTPFLVGGVEKLMGLLARRNEAPEAPGFKIAQTALRFIEAKDGEEEVSGASVEKLRLIAGRVAQMRGAP